MAAVIGQKGLEASDGLGRAQGRRSQPHRQADPSPGRTEATDLFTATAWRIKEKLRWIRKAESVQAARWRITAFIRHARDGLADEAILEPVRKALETFEKHLEPILQRWTSTHNNARIEGLNSLFQAARTRARGRAIFF